MFLRLSGYQIESKIQKIHGGSCFFKDVELRRPILQHSRIFIILFLSLFVAMLGAGVIAPTMPLYADTLGATGFCLGIIYSAFSISRAIFMPVAGKLSDRKGRKIFITMGLTIYTLASLGYIWSDSIVELVWIRFLHGIGSAMIIPIAAAAIGDISPHGREGTMMGTFNVALFLGFGAGPLLGGVVLDSLGMAWVFYIMGTLSCISLLSVVIFLPEKRNNQIQKVQSISTFRTMWKDKMFKGLLSFRFSNAVGRGSVTAFIPIFANKLDISPSLIGVLISLNILLTGVLQHVFGRVADRVDRRFLIILGNLIGAIPMFFTPFARSFSHLVIMGMVMGVGGGLAFPAASAVATKLGRSHGMGNVMGYFNQSMSFGMIAGPVIAGLVMDRFGISVVFIVGGSIGFIGSALTYYWMVFQDRKGCYANV